jgi:WD40-like Beta Propeller Repeat
MSVRHRRTAAAVVIAATAVAGALVPTLASAAPLSAPAANTTFVHSATRGLTVSDGSRWVVIDGKRVNFGTDVHDLAWNPNGSGRVVVVKHVAGETFSHPTWQVAKRDSVDQIPAKNNLIFVASKKGTTRLERVVATAHDGKPADLTLVGYPGDGGPLPTTGNNWPNAGGTIGSIVYDNTHTGEVYIRDDYLRQQGGAMVAGSEPALSPNGEEIVFVRSVGGHDHIFEETFSSKPVVQDLTPHATANYTEPTFSSDGSAIAFRTPNGIDVMPDHGRGGPVKVSSHTGLPAYRG